MKVISLFRPIEKLSLRKESNFLSFMFSKFGQHFLRNKIECITLKVFHNFIFQKSLRIGKDCSEDRSVGSIGDFNIKVDVKFGGDSHNLEILKVTERFRTYVLIRSVKRTPERPVSKHLGREKVKIIYSQC